MLFAVAALGLSTVGCSPEESAPAAMVEGQALADPVTIAVRRELSYAPFYIGDLEGYFRDEGIEIEMVQIAEIDARIALEQGEIDAYGGISNPGFFNSVRRGSATRMVADRGHATANCAAYAILARASLLERGNLDYSDIKGMTVNYRPSSYHAHMIDAILERGGLTLADITPTDSLGLAWIDSMAEGRLDIKPAAEPQVTLAVDQGVAKVWKLVDDIHPGYQFSLLFFGERLMKDRELGNKFMVAYLRAVRQFQEGKTDRNVEIVSEFTRLEPKLARKACWAEISPGGVVNTQSVDSYQNWAVKNGYLDEAVPAKTYYDDGFIEFANAELERRSKTQ